MSFKAILSTLIFNGIYFYSTSLLFAQKNDSNNISLTISMVDIPYQWHVLQTYSNKTTVLTNPGMNNALHWSNNFYILSHFYIKKLIKNDTYSQIGILVYDLLSFYLPLGVSWMHEEFHRAVLTKNHISSFNDVYKFPFFSEFIAVSHVKDTDLVQLANYHKADFRRLNTAGMESQVLQVKNLQQNNFFNQHKNYCVSLYLLSLINTFSYIHSCSNPKWDVSVDEAIQKEGNDINKRDMTGLDFTAWADALFNPDKPYEARGLHPSGVGYNRYIKPSSLSLQARKYLKTQSYLNLLNFLSPMIAGINDIKINKDISANASFRHYLTPFGNNIALDVFINKHSKKFIITLNSYSNKNRTYAGIEYNFIDYTINKAIQSSIILNTWIQPSNLDFYDRKGKWGGLLGIFIKYKHPHLQPFVHFGYKTKGWVPGIVYLESAWYGNFGINCIFN
ncbi:MAG: hypothetical protein N2449_03760 [Bacteroidales bacterium]|nr:hypothetical protein [Bacteroidales bacterium]